MKKPLYVKIGLYAIHTRKVAKYYSYFCLSVAAVAFIAGVLVHTKYFVGLVLLISAFWYEVSIRWMDRNNAWESNNNT